MFSDCTVLPDSKENKLGSSDQEVSPSASKITAYYKTRNTGTRSTGTVAEQRRNSGTLAEQRNDNGTREHKRNNGTTKQHQEILPIQNDDIIEQITQQNSKQECYFSKKEFY